ncbi:hypothetical protein DA075_10440 [Methylobacterium currus]|jgi:hypothetical protein|uniref:Uncharacterized protein n=1 Tax=Methylobacterium currus TaxID=2051553 RepID=A0A2R4WIB5_9HYPH|nr:hypothetical protein [Methylobacterium currus]AWB21278.1 hypothetical protein DA075_10440 [Methylobacterium currus]
MRSGFGCESCGSPGVRLPADLTDDAMIQCDRCGCTLMAWGAFKRRVEAQEAADTREPAERRAVGAAPQAAR